MKLELSIIVAMYNTKEYLSSFFSCLENQTFKNFEVIIVDDVSTDGSKEFVRDYITKSKLNIRLIESEVKLLPDLARKTAFNLCAGDYVIYLDTDDEFTDDYLDSMISLTVKNDLDFVVSSCQRINENSKKIKKRRELSRDTIPLLTDEQKKLLIGGRYGGWNRMCKREYLINHNYNYLSAELPLFILQFDKDAKVGITNKGCYYYRARGGSISRAGVPKRIAEYDLLEPLDWYKKINLSRKNKDVLGLYVFRMVLPYIYYKKYALKDYDFKADIKYVRKTCDFKWKTYFKVFRILEKRDKFITFVFALRLHWIAFLFIKKFRN